MAKQKSRNARWAEAAQEARVAFDELSSQAANLTDALNSLHEVQSEYQDWNDSLPENLQGSALGEKLAAVTEIDTESIAEDPLGNWESVESAIDEAEGAELPLGFGRD